MLQKVFPDKEKVKSIIKMISEREKFVSVIGKKEFSTIIAENYYEIIKELSTALLLLNRIKIIGENAHKEIIDSLAEYAKFTPYEISLLQDLRIKRNQSQYEGKQIDVSYLENKKEILQKIMNKLKKIIQKDFP